MRKGKSVYMDEEIYKVFTKYASMKNLGEAYLVWEDALVDYMKVNPIDGLKLVVQRVESELPSRVDDVKIKLLTPQIMGLVEKLKTERKNEFPELRGNLAKLIRKGLGVKHSSKEFVMLLEEATNHV